MSIWKILEQEIFWYPLRQILRNRFLYTMEKCNGSLIILEEDTLICLVAFSPLVWGTVIRKIAPLI